MLFILLLGFSFGESRGLSSGMFLVHSCATKSLRPHATFCDICGQLEIAPAMVITVVSVYNMCAANALRSELLSRIQINIS